MNDFPDNIDPADIHYLLDNPWQVSENEWGLHGESSFDEINSYIKNHLDLTKKDGFSKIWRTRLHKPIAILGCYKVADKMYESFFFASQHMEEHAMHITMEIRRTLKEQTIGYNGCTCSLYSSSDHPKQIAWFQFLGFKYIPEGNIGKARYFEFTVPL